MKKTDPGEAAAKSSPPRRGRSATRLRTKPDAAAAPQADGRKRPRGAQVRERVLQAALECFGAFGFEGTSTRAVAERAGVTHTLLLYHFDSKDALWRSTMEAVMKRFLAALDERLAAVPRTDAAACLRAYIENFVRFSARVPQLYRIMTMESTQGSERIAWLIETYLRGYFEQVRDLIRRGQAAGKVRDGDSARLYYAIIGLAGTPLAVSSEFRILTGRDVFTEGEIYHTIGFIFDIVFV
ncbi:MAG: TetR family transcriptional regulator [Nevskia sp.]|nr:TetR family transcriptional regulator [Nevskia sp.]